MCHYGEQSQFYSLCCFFRQERKPKANQFQQERCLILSISCLIGTIVETGDGFSSCDKWILVASSYLSDFFFAPFIHAGYLLWHSLTKSGFTLPILVRRLTCSVKLQYSVMSDSVGVCYPWSSQRNRLFFHNKYMFMQDFPWAWPQGDG